MNALRRSFIRSSLAIAAGGALGLTQWRRALAATTLGAGPYGALSAADRNGLRLPAGFSSRVIATSGQPVRAGGYVWHSAPDGGATFALPGGGWVYVCNSEVDRNGGGAGAIRFDARGDVVDAYRVLAGTSINCAGGATPWGTWLSCEEQREGQVWECSVGAASQGVVRPALGRFAHEASAVDAATGMVYLTEDDPEGRLYRFVPATRGDLSAGRLYAASVAGDGSVGWVPASAGRPYRGRDSSAFARGEGAWLSGGVLYVCTTADHRVWALDLAAQRMSVLYDAATAGAAAPLRSPDNVTVHAPSSDIFVCEDGDDLELVLLAATPGGQRVVAPFLQLSGHEGSELAGVAFDPQGERMLLSSQRGVNAAAAERRGLTFEISGPFRAARPRDKDRPRPGAPGSRPRATPSP